MLRGLWLRRLQSPRHSLLSLTYRLAPPASTPPVSSHPPELKPDPGSFYRYYGRNLQQLSKCRLFISSYLNTHRNSAPCVILKACLHSSQHPGLCLAESARQSVGQPVPRLPAWPRCQSVKTYNCIKSTPLCRSLHPDLCAAESRYLKAPFVLYGENRLGADPGISTWRACLSQLQIITRNICSGVTSSVSWHRKIGRMDHLHLSPASSPV